MKFIITASCCAFFFAGSLSAQWWDRIAYNGGAGIDEPFLSSKTNLKLGKHLQGGVGYNFTPRISLMLEGEYDIFSLSSKALASLGYPSGFNSIGDQVGYTKGNVHEVSVTLDPVYHLHPKGSWDAYIIGGGGSFHRTVGLTEPTTATATLYNPYFGLGAAGYPASTSPLNASNYKPGLDIGVGFSVTARWHTKIYLEAKYNHVFLGAGQHMDYLPVTLGVRW